MRNFFVFLVLKILSLNSALAYIPSSKMILEKVVENSLKLPLYVEQQVNLVSGGISASLKEQWLFESESTARLIVRGEKELYDQILFQINYNEIQKTSSLMGVAQSNRMTHPLFERIFFIKNDEQLKKYLVQHGIVNNDIFSSQNFKKIPGNNGFQYQPEPFLRLGRIAGRIAYIIGPSPQNESLTPGFWIEQDLFNIMKIRNSWGEEMRIDKIATYSRGVRWPKSVDMSWGSNLARAQINVISVKNASTSLRNQFQKKSDIRAVEFEQQKSKLLIEDFYQKFR